jgi:inosine-uridine nucleoside N-ribohydrolase
MAIPILLDCDPGHDDAIALLLALASPELELLGVTTTYGNQTLEKTTANALRVLELVERTDVPVAAGAERPHARSSSSRRTSTARAGSTDRCFRMRGQRPSPRTRRPSRRKRSRRRASL